VKRIDRRFDAMVTLGALEEVRALARRRLDPALPAMRAHGVPWLIRALAGEMTLGEAIERAKADTRHYAKRQFTWFRHQAEGWTWAPPEEGEAAVLQAMGWLYMDPLDCPFRGTAEVLAKYRLGSSVQAIVADIHAEASSEKMAYGHIFDGQVSLVVGTHTHCPTADAQVLPGGTAFQSDAGMCGDYDSVIGMVKSGATLRFWRKMPGEKLGPAEGEATICGVFVETDDLTGLARRIEPVRTGGRLAEAIPVV